MITLQSIRSLSNSTDHIMQPWELYVEKINLIVTFLVFNSLLNCNERREIQLRFLIESRLTTYLFKDIQKVKNLELRQKNVREIDFLINNIYFTSGEHLKLTGGGQG